MNIPKIIHFCWFGRSRKPATIERFIHGWKSLLPEYRFSEWNERNLDVPSSRYAEQAYRARKYAFVSDYARAYVLYHHGGIYLDTDVEVLKPFDDLLGYRSFWGFEAGNFIASSTIGVVPRHEVIKSYLEQYRSLEFSRPDGSFETITNVQVLTRLWQQRGLILNNEKQIIEDGDLFLPQSYFSPLDYRTGTMNRSGGAYTIHHYHKTWLGPWARVKGRVKRLLSSCAGPGTVVFLKNMIKKGLKDPRKGDRP